MQPQSKLQSEIHTDSSTNGNSANGDSANGASHNQHANGHVPHLREDGELSPAEQSELHVAQGDLKGDDGDFLGALSEYKKAARLKPESASHLSRVAEGYAASDQPYKAIEYYQRALHARRDQTGEADLPEAHIGLGDLCHSFAYSAAAIRSYERAVRSRPRQPFYRWKLAVALATLGLYEKSVQQLLAALEISPDDAFYHFQLADVYLLMHREDDAILEFERAAELAPRDEYYRLRLGAALLRAGRTEEAVRHFERATEMKPDNASYRTILRYAYARNAQEPEISVDIELLELGSYDEDFVRRFQKLSQPV
jgi:tetratricopeptide (TPR) repeat protein